MAAGFPQLREYGWLHPPGSEVPIAGVRLEERMDGSGWDVLVNDPAGSPTQRVNYPDEASARTALQRLYEQGRADGEWQVRRPDNPHDGPQVTAAGR